MDLFDIAVARKLSGGGGGGGGGDSDFSTATAVISNKYSVSCEIPACDENGDGCYAISNLMGDLDSASFTIPLYKGKALVFFNSENITTTGDIEDDGDGYYFITGDCTITIS